MDRFQLGCVVAVVVLGTACKVTKREGGDTSWRGDLDAATSAASATPPGEFPKTSSSAAPTAAEWETALPVEIPGSDAPCTAVRVREWLRVSCAQKDRPIDGVQVVRTHGWPESVTTVDTPQLASVVLPVRGGADFVVEFLLPDGERDLTVFWSLPGRQPSLALKKPMDPHDKLRCRAPTKSGPCCYRSFSATSFHPELQCDRSRYEELCTSDADCDSRTNRTCRAQSGGLKSCISK